MLLSSPLKHSNIVSQKAIVTSNFNAPLTQTIPQTATVTSDTHTSTERVDSFMHQIFSYMENCDFRAFKYNELPEKNIYRQEAKSLARQIANAFELEDGYRRVGILPFRAANPENVFVFELKQSEFEMKIFEIDFSRPFDDFFVGSVPNLKFADFINLISNSA